MTPIDMRPSKGPAQGRRVYMPNFVTIRRASEEIGDREKQTELF